MYDGCANRRASSATVDLAPAGHEHDLDAGAVAGLERADAGEGEAVVAAAQERAVGAEQGAVEVDVEGAHGPTSWRTGRPEPAADFAL